MRNEKISFTYVSLRGGNLSLVAGESALKEAGAITGNTDMTLYLIVERLLKLSRGLAFSQDKENGFTPLHTAFQSGNLEVALWIMAVV